jgi:large subunit ribosomal protein L21
VSRRRVKSSFVPKPDGSLTAVVVSGGKQYRVAAGDRIVVDRVAADAGSELTLGKVLLVADGDDFKVGPSALDGVSVVARVIGHQRGPKIDAFRYKSKKRVRVRRGSRAELTALEIVEIGGKGRAKPKQAEAGEPCAGAGVEPEKKPRRARKPAAAEAAAEPEAKPAPKRTRARKPAGEEAGGEEDGS